MASLLAVVVVAILAFLMIRIGATALELTGLSRDAARFQALSAFFGAGFTTRESELVVDHKVRRRIISHLIVLGNIGVASGITAVIFSFVGTESSKHAAAQVGVLLLLLVALWLASRTRFLQVLVDRSIRWSLNRTGLVHALDYGRLLHIHSGFGVDEITLGPAHRVAGRTLGETDLHNVYGVIVLGVSRANGEFIGAPNASTRLEAGDTIVLYGPEASIEALDEASVAPPADPA